MKRTIGRWAASLQNYLTTAQRLSFATLCGLLLVSGALAQEGRPEPLPAPEQSTPEASPTLKAPDPNETLTPNLLANQVVDGDFVFTSPGQFTYPRDIRLSDNFGGLRFYGADSLTTSPAGAAIQFFGNNANPYRGQLYLDSGADHAAALIFRTAPGGGTITERMRVTSNGRVGIGTSDTLNGTLRVVNTGSLHAVRGETSAVDGYGVYGISTGSDTEGTGVYGQGTSNATGVFGRSHTGTGVVGQSAFGFAGQFFGDVQVTGRLTKSSGSFKIDHPLDPENKYLSHSFVESPDMMNIYNGIVTLDRRGRATVTMPEWFDALNKDFRYQLTPIGGFAPLYVARKLSGNRFQIAGGRRGMEVSWQVTGVRQDAYAKKHRIAVEEDKPASERGTYLNPEAFGQPAAKRADRGQQPEASQPATAASAQRKEK